MNPRQVAIETAARYDTNNPFEIARERNIRILHQPLKTTLGFYVRYRRIQSIILNDTLSEGMQRFVCAHELGHSILHADLNVPKLTSYTLFRATNLSSRRTLLPSNCYFPTICCANILNAAYSSLQILLVCRKNLQI